MTFEVNEQDAKKLIHLIGLGNDMINEYRDSNDRKNEYIEFAHRLMEEYLKQKQPDLTMSQVKGYTEDIEFVEDGVRSACWNYVKAYEKSVLPYGAAQLFADRMCPVDAESEESWEMNDLAYEVFLDKILETGTSIIHIDYPDFKAEMDRRYKEGEENKIKAAVTL